MGYPDHGLSTLGLLRVYSDQEPPGHLHLSLPVDHPERVPVLRSKNHEISEVPS